MAQRRPGDDTAVRRYKPTAPRDADGVDKAGEAPSVPVPALTIVWHPRARRAGERVLLYPLGKGGEVQLSRVAPDFLRAGASAGTPLDDPYVSRKPIVLRTGPRGGVTIVAPAEGTRVVCGQAVIDDQLDVPPEALAEGVPLVLAGRVVLLLHLVEATVNAGNDAMGMVGDGAGIRRVRVHVDRVADIQVPVLIRGETGTGKELVARAIHEKSPRRAGPFVAVNLASIPTGLASAELFGMKKGAFTGATHDRDGRFQSARGGTLFLDEVGEAATDVQALLLRALETSEVYPVGATAPERVDVRLIAATDANLEAQIEKESFKAPLLHRLSGYEIRTPPLRERREDIGLLVYHFAKEELTAIGESHRLESTDPYTEPWLPPALATLLVTYRWPGNIRQLRNVVRRIVIGSRGQATTQLDPQLEAELSGGAPPSPAQTTAAPGPPAAPQPSPSQQVPGMRRKPSEVSEAELVAALRANAWDLKAAAEQLGITRASIYDLIDRSPNIRKAGDLSVEEIVSCFHDCGGDLDQMVGRLEVSKWALRRRLNELGLKGR